MFLLFIFGLIFVVLSLLLILFVLIQPGKSGGMGGLGASSAGGAITESLGATSAEKKLSNLTAMGMGVFFFLCLLLTFMANRGQRGVSLEGLADERPALVAPATSVIPAAATTEEAAPATDGAPGVTIETDAPQSSEEAVPPVQQNPEAAGAVQ